jgi:hypothetical protein
MQRVAEDSRSEPDDGILVPYRKEWASLLDAVVLPVYNLFDLHNSRLLTAAQTPSSPPTDCPDNTRRAPPYMFLLRPGHYIKADGPPVSGQFENEARTGIEGTAGESAEPLARQFIVIGCERSDQKALEDEWNRILEGAFSLFVPAGARVPRELLATPPRGPCGDFVHGVFSGRAFVELRHNFSINGKRVENGTTNLQTIGQIVAYFSPHQDPAERSSSKPLVEVLRSNGGAAARLGVSAIKLRFYTTEADVLDQTTVFEGDEIYVGSISEVLR